MTTITTTSGKQFNANEGESLLDAALRAQVTLAYSCHTGRCSTCRGKVRSGTTAVIHDELGLSLAEREAGWILTCARTATSDVEVEVEDLGGIELFAAKVVPCRIQSLERLSADVIKVMLRLPPTSELRYHPGQYVDVIGPNGLGVAFLLPPIYTAKTVILPPQQQQSGAAAALASLGGLAGLAGGLGGAAASPADKYVAMMQSATVSNHVIDKFKLMDVYESKFRVDAQKVLTSNVRIAAGKKDGLLSIEVDDENAGRSAEMANHYVDELRALTASLAVTGAQQRRVFFEQQLQKTKEKLTAAQVALQASGFNAGALKAEPKAAADGYAKLRAEITAAEVRLQTMHGMLADNAPEILQQQATLGALRRQLAALEVSTKPGNDADYIGRYREFKYQETLFDLFAKQYELARVEESREGALIQVVHVAQPPEKKSKPQRALLALGGALLAGFLLVVRAVLVGISQRAMPSRVMASSS